MARLTFKEFININEESDVVTGSLEMVPKKYEYVSDPNDPTGVTKIKVISRQYSEYMNSPAGKGSNFPSDQDKLKVDIDKPEKTEFASGDSVPKIITSGGLAKERAQKMAGVPRTNEYFYGRSDFFNIDPSLYRPQNMLIQSGRR